MHNCFYFFVNIFIPDTKSKFNWKHQYKEYIIGTPGHEKPHITVVLAVLGIGKVFDSLVIFKGRIGRPIKDFVIKKSYLWVNPRKKPWCMRKWWLFKSTKNDSICKTKVFKTHHVYNVQVKLITNNPWGCTLEVQPLYVSLNKFFKGNQQMMLEEFCSKRILTTPCK